MTFDAPTLLLSLLAPLAGGAAADHAAVCAGRTDDAARLRCWDRLALGVVTPPAPAFARPDHAIPDAAPAADTAPVQGAWRLRATPGFDGEEVIAALRSDAPVGCGAGHATLYLRCVDGRTSLYLLHGCDTRAIDEDWPVEMRIDGGPARTVQMRPAAEGDALGLWTYAAARPVAEAMTGARALRLRFRDYLGRTRAVGFAARGAGAAVHAVRSACGW
ncbi:hypothetical protein JQC91_00300 [Jannaschia sp. Os4]|uniref:hypothetical protein n=1 Tax=Jannaschia sp. Os4 TaxID=2807617 RepID=UPI00193AB827|nr:hypothetical protein [Jannaschia sp. Os4]MBM2574730.1 hypothetical protein [Jannaschia sp. Os4]